MSNDLTEESMLSLLAEIRRVDSRPLTIRPTHVTVCLCPICEGITRYDEPFYMCDRCKRVVGQDLR
jgi:hypothetical protein